MAIKLGNCRIYAPLDRYYGLGTGGPSLDEPILRAYELLSLPKLDVPWESPTYSERITLRPFEGGKPFRSLCYLYLDLKWFPAISSRPTHVRLTTQHDIAIDSSYLVPLHLDKKPGFFSRVLGWETAQIRMLRELGLEHGRTYEVNDWIVDGKLVKLRDVVGVYYIALFVDAESGAPF